MNDNQFFDKATKLSSEAADSKLYYEASILCFLLQVKAQGRLRELAEVVRDFGNESMKMAALDAR